jgi:hypothetical protein
MGKQAGRQKVSRILIRFKFIVNTNKIYYGKILTLEVFLVNTLLKILFTYSN